jgi:splicing suppressor protein 51
MCGQCNKASASLKRCAKCHTVSYCDRVCQKAHWKTHKKTCALPAASQGCKETTSEGPSSSNESARKRSDNRPFHALYKDVFLHDRSEIETFKLLIDTIRMRQEDMYTFHADTMTGTIYNGEASSVLAFRDFIKKAKEIHGFLPPWWTDAKLKECIRLSRSGELKDDFSLSGAQEKSDIQETWADTQMPMKLRMLGERVYGTAPSGRSGKEMLGLMMGL